MALCQIQEIPRCTRDDVRAVTKANQQTGFTLIELLVVLLIISLSFTFAMVAFGHFGTNREAKMTAEKIQHVIVFLREQALLESSDLQMVFSQSGYAATQSGLPSFTTGTLPHGLMLSFHPAAPRLIVHFSASGAMTPFTIDIGSTTHPALVTLSGHANGTLN